MITELSQVSNNGDRIAKLINIEDEDLENETKSRVKEMLACNYFGISRGCRMPAIKTKEGRGEKGKSEAP